MTPNCSPYYSYLYFEISWTIKKKFCCTDSSCTPFFKPNWRKDQRRHIPALFVWSLEGLVRLCITPLFYKNNFKRTMRLKFAEQLRTSSGQLRLGFRCKCNCKVFIEKHSTSRHYVWRFAAGLSSIGNTE